MAFESVTDEMIAALLVAPKKIVNPGARWADKPSHRQVNYVVHANDGEHFTLYARQNVRVAQDFSCGLAWHAPGGETLTLVRYNGPSHTHRDPLSREPLPMTCHIHRASQACIEAGRKPEPARGRPAPTKH